MRFPTRQYDHQLYPAPNSPYYLFGYQQRWPWAWSGGAGGILPNTRAADSSLGNADLYESGYGDPNWLPYPALQRTILHPRPFSLSDWPLVRPAGPEPQGPGDGGFPLGMLSDNEKIALVAAAGVAAWWFLFRKRRRRNPRRRGYYVLSKVRGVSGAIVLPTKHEAMAYAKRLREAGRPARVKKR